MQIQILPSYKIDKQKWDDCIKQSSNPLIYATSVYLDYMADNWEGYISNDYSMVMPVTWRKKFGIKYCYHAPFIQQLGVFGKNFMQAQVDVFINCFKSNYRYGDYAFNYTNQSKDAIQHNNYILLLSSKYKILREFYLSHLEKNLHKSKKFSLIYEEGDVSETITMFRQLYSEKVKQITPVQYSNFEALCRLKKQENNLVLRRIKSTNDEVLACVLLMKDECRYYNLIMCLTQTGRQQAAGSFLYDELIKELSHSGMMLDFEGSDLEGVEFFYKGFGAVNQPYCSIHVNNLGFPLSLLKR